MLQVLRFVRWAAFGVLALALVFSGPVAAAEKNLKVAVLVPASRTDQGWNQAAPDGILAIQEKWALDIQIAEDLGYGNIRPVLEDLAQQKFDLIICHASGYATPCTEAARELNIPMAVIEYPQGITPGLVTDVIVEAQEGAYLAGVLAGKMTRTGTVAVAVSAEAPTWNFMTVGFIEGLHSVRPDAQLLYGVIGQAAYEDAAGGRRLVESQIAAGADVIFGMGNGATFGMMQAVGRSKARDGGKVWFIDVIGDKRSSDPNNILLTSVLFDYSTIYDQMLVDLVTNRFGRALSGTLANGGVRLLELPEEVGPEARAAVDAAFKQIVSGEIEVSAVFDAEGVHSRMAELFPR